MSWLLGREPSTCVRFELAEFDKILTKIPDGVDNYPQNSNCTNPDYWTPVNTWTRPVSDDPECLARLRLQYLQNTSGVQGEPFFIVSALLTTRGRPDHFGSPNTRVGGSREQILNISTNAYRCSAVNSSESSTSITLRSVITVYLSIAEANSVESNQATEYLHDLRRNQLWSYRILPCACVLHTVLKLILSRLSFILRLLGSNRREPIIKRQVLRAQGELF